MTDRCGMCGNAPCTCGSGPATHVVVSKARLERALRDCIARAGTPDPVDACRNVIATARAALDGEEGA